jgi:hypothetical protein
MNVDKLKALKACGDAVAWAEAQPNAKTAWANCTRGDWMLWLVERSENAPQYWNKMLLDAYDAVDAVYAANPTRKETLAKCADIVREHFPHPPKL